MSWCIVNINENKVRQANIYHVSNITIPCMKQVIITVSLLHKLVLFTFQTVVNSRTNIFLLSVEAHVISGSDLGLPIVYASLVDLMYVERCKGL